MLRIDNMLLYYLSVMFKILSTLSKVPVEALEKVTNTLTQFAAVTEILADEQKISMVQKNLAQTISVVAPVLGNQLLSMLDDPRCKNFLASEQVEHFLKQIADMNIGGAIRINTASSQSSSNQKRNQSRDVTNESRKKRRTSQK